MVKFTEKICHGKLRFLCSVRFVIVMLLSITNNTYDQKYQIVRGTFLDLDSPFLGVSMNELQLEESFLEKRFLGYRFFVGQINTSFRVFNNLFFRFNLFMRNAEKRPNVL